LNPEDIAFQRYLKIYEYVSTALPMKLKMKFIFFYIVIILKILGNKLINDIQLKYAGFESLGEQDKIIFIFNNVDTYICQKLGYFIYEA